MMAPIELPALLDGIVVLEADWLDCPVRHFDDAGRAVPHGDIVSFAGTPADMPNPDDCIVLELEIVPVRDGRRIRRVSRIAVLREVPWPRYVF